LTGALLGVGTAAALGVPLGLIAGYSGGWVDGLISRVVEIWLGFPPLLLAIIIVARVGPSLKNAVIALGIVSMPSFFRITRSCALKIRRSGYTEAARALGAGHPRVVLRHVLPNIASSLVVLTTMRMGRFVLAGGALTFVGLGAQPPTPEWGALLAGGRDYLTTAPWLALFPGGATMLAVLGFNLLGEGLRDLLEVQNRREFRVPRDL
jgi:ABC-type dipeptide/oligopeptide/nickel transport system permease subunit